VTFLEAITARMAAGDRPPGVVANTDAAVFSFKAPRESKVPFIVLKPQPGSFADDTATRGHDDPVQVSAHAAGPADAVTLLNSFTDWAEEARAWDVVAPEVSVVLTPAAPRVFQNPSGTYQATCDLTARIERDRPR